MKTICEKLGELDFDEYLVASYRSPYIERLVFWFLLYFYNRRKYGAKYMRRIGIFTYLKYASS